MDDFIVGAAQSEDKEDHICLGKIRGDCGKGDNWTELHKKSKNSPPMIQKPSSRQKEEHREVGKMREALEKEFTCYNSLNGV